jgi:hypothetical protein
MRLKSFYQKKFLFCQIKIYWPSKDIPDGRQYIGHKAARGLVTNEFKKSKKNPKKNPKIQNQKIKKIQRRASF